jgi:DnaJ-domain-containing protein 1
MSIGKRLIDLARSELNSLLDRAAARDRFDARDERDPDEDLYQRYGMSTISDEELEAELERRRAARLAAEKARAARATTGAGAGARPRASGAPPPRPTVTPAEELRRAYASLEVTPGSDFETVRAAYRRLMRKYHPDRHAQTPEKQKAATELAQKLTQAYKLLEKQLRK